MMKFQFKLYVMVQIIVLCSTLPQIQQKQSMTAAGVLSEANQHALSLASLVTGTTHTILGHIRDHHLEKIKNSSLIAPQSSKMLIALSGKTEKATVRKRSVSNGSKNMFTAMEQPCEAKHFDLAKDVINDCGRLDDAREAIADSIVFPVNAGAATKINSPFVELGEAEELDDDDTQADARMKRNTDLARPTEILNYSLIVEHKYAPFHHDEEDVQTNFSQSNYIKKDIHRRMCVLGNCGEIYMPVDKSTSAADSAKIIAFESDSA